MSNQSIDRRTAEHTTKNLDLIERFLREGLDDPAILDALPNEATLVPISPDDPELNAANLGLAYREAAKGKNVHRPKVDRQRLDAEAWEATKVER